MFSIYGESGRIFQGPMEELWRVGELRGPSAIGRLGAGQGSARVARRRPGGNTSSSGSPVPAGPAPSSNAGTGAALAAYAQVGDTSPRRHPLSRVGDVMSRQPVSVPPDMSVLQAWQHLNQAGVGQAPVVRADGALVGLLCRADLLDLQRLPQPDVPGLVWRAWLMEPVSSVMISPVPAPVEDTELRRVARVLLDTHLPGLPVVEPEGALIGFVSRSDILQAIVHDPPLDLWS